MVSRESRLMRMTAWFMEVPSDTDMVEKLTGTPPPAATPSLARSAWGARFMEQGVFSPWVLTMPTMDFCKASSSKPVPRRNARCGARLSPWVTMRERCLCKDMESIRFGKEYLNRQGLGLEFVESPADVAFHGK